MKRKAGYYTIKSVKLLFSEDRSLLAPLAKMEFVRKQDCVARFNNESNVGREFKIIF